MVTPQSVQDHTGLTHHFINFWHSGSLALRTERQRARMSKIKNGGLDQYVPERFGRLILLYSQKNAGLIGLSHFHSRSAISCCVCVPPVPTNVIFRSHQMRRAKFSLRCIPSSSASCSRNNQHYKFQKKKLFCFKKRSSTLCRFIVSHFWILDLYSLIFFMPIFAVAERWSFFMQA